MIKMPTNVTLSATGDVAENFEIYLKHVYGQQVIPDRLRTQLEQAFIGGALSLCASMLNTTKGSSMKDAQYTLEGVLTKLELAARKYVDRAKAAREQAAEN